MAKKKAGSRPAGNKYKLLGVRPNDELRAQIEALAASERRSVAQMGEILLEEALAARKKRKGD